MARYKNVSEVLADLESKRTDRTSVPLSTAASFPATPREDIWKTVDVERFGLAAVTAKLLRRYDEAAAYCYRVLAIEPDHQGARSILDEIEDRDRRAESVYRYLEAHLNDANQGELVLQLAKARGIYPNHRSDEYVGRHIEDRRRRYRNAMDEGFRLVRRGDKRAALQAFREAQEADPSDSHVSSMIRDLEDDVYRGKPLPFGW